MFKKKLWIYCLIVVCLAVLPELTGCNSKTPQDPRNFNIITGPDGNLWFTDNRGNKIGEISPATGRVTEYNIPTKGSYPIGIAAGPDGNLWFTESTGNKIAKISPSSGKITEYNIATQMAAVDGIAAGPDGNLWFTEYSEQQHRDYFTGDGCRFRIRHSHRSVRPCFNCCRFGRQSLVRGILIVAE
jgi:sugar lactone lactonase YvrE